MYKARITLRIRNWNGDLGFDQSKCNIAEISILYV